MTLENNAFDKRLVELNAQLVEIQKAIETIEKAKHEYIYENKRKKFLIDNSIELKEVILEVHDGNYFIVAKDDTFEYVLRLTKDQAEYLADDLDEELSNELDTQLNQGSSMVQDMLNPIFKNINFK
jgi:hypothetical protein